MFSQHDERPSKRQRLCNKENDPQKQSLCPQDRAQPSRDAIYPDTINVDYLGQNLQHDYPDTNTIPPAIQYHHGRNDSTTTIISSIKSSIDQEVGGVDVWDHICSYLTLKELLRTIVLVDRSCRYYVTHHSREPWMHNTINLVPSNRNTNSSVAYLHQWMPYVGRIRHVYVRGGTCKNSDINDSNVLHSMGEFRHLFHVFLQLAAPFLHTLRIQLFLYEQPLASYPFRQLKKLHLVSSAPLSHAYSTQNLYRYIEYEPKTVEQVCIDCVCKNMGILYSTNYCSTKHHFMCDWSLRYFVGIKKLDILSCPRSENGKIPHLLLPQNTNTLRSARIHAHDKHGSTAQDVFKAMSCNTISESFSDNNVTPRGHISYNNSSAMNNNMTTILSAAKTTSHVSLQPYWHNYLALCTQIRCVNFDFTCNYHTKDWQALWMPLLQQMHDRCTQLHTLYLQLPTGEPQSFISSMLHNMIMVRFPMVRHLYLCNRGPGYCPYFHVPLADIILAFPRVCRITLLDDYMGFDWHAPLVVGVPQHSSSSIVSPEIFSSKLFLSLHVSNFRHFISPKKERTSDGGSLGEHMGTTTTTSHGEHAMIATASPNDDPMDEEEKQEACGGASFDHIRHLCVHVRGVQDEYTDLFDEEMMGCLGVRFPQVEHLVLSSMTKNTDNHNNDDMYKNRVPPEDDLFMICSHFPNLIHLHLDLIHLNTRRIFPRNLQHHNVALANEPLRNLLYHDDPLLARSVHQDLGRRLPKKITIHGCYGKARELQLFLAAYFTEVEQVTLQTCNGYRAPSAAQKDNNGDDICVEEHHHDPDHDARTLASHVLCKCNGPHVDMTLFHRVRHALLQMPLQRRLKYIYSCKSIKIFLCRCLPEDLFDEIYDE